MVNPPFFFFLFFSFLAFSPPLMPPFKPLPLHLHLQQSNPTARLLQATGSVCQRLLRSSGSSVVAFGTVAASERRRGGSPNYLNVPYYRQSRSATDPSNGRLNAVPGVAFAPGSNVEPASLSPHFPTTTPPSQISWSSPSCRRIA
jgi:hypothetical protein